MARSSKFLESAQCSTFEEAYQAAKQKITERKRADNQRAEIQRKALGIKGKDRHRKDRRTKEGQIGKMTNIKLGMRISIPSIPDSVSQNARNQISYSLQSATDLVSSVLQRYRGKTLVMTGAGVSVDSGIAPYRGKDGHYTVHKSYRPIFFHEFTDQTEKGHAYRQSIGNVDSLHHLATPSASLAASSILELHGTLQNVVCVASPTGTNPEHHTHSHAKPIDQALFDRLSLSHLTKGGPRKPPEPQPRNTPVGRLAYPKGCGFRGSRAAFQVELAQNNPQWDKLANDMEQHGTQPKTNPDGDVELERIPIILLFDIVLVLNAEES
ncbi:hypothetical protein IEQ34_025207 [Dendrobium chrysotoxum]|uniref:Deacetylase sirtuin-type domain-containing protein n=1 Tax=Dendrobium chrysotoxum TaxID=161865 RepID=A0AAV7FQH8_DENCH|nr:hypothetical protein IEQ34_025207 [Dendrobium chrysotoxum]